MIIVRRSQAEIIDALKEYVEKHDQLCQQSPAKSVIQRGRDDGFVTGMQRAIAIAEGRL